MAGMGYGLTIVLRAAIRECGDQDDVLDLLKTDTAEDRPTLYEAENALNCITARAAATERADLTLAAAVMRAALAAYRAGHSYGQWEMESKQERIENLRLAALREFNQWCKDHPEDDPEGDGEIISDIADSHIPIYTTSLLEVMINDNGLACWDGEGATCQAIAHDVIYQDLKEVLYERWKAIKEEREEQEDLADEDDEESEA